MVIRLRWQHFLRPAGFSPCPGGGSREWPPLERRQIERDLDIRPLNHPSQRADDRPNLRQDYLPSRTVQHDQRYFPTGEVLLIGNVAVAGDHARETGGLRLPQ